MRTAMPRGFTLLELAVTLAVLGISLSLALPSLERWFASRRLAGATDAVADALRYARKSAITGQQPVHIVSRGGGAWSLQVDADADASCDNALACVNGADYRGVRLQAADGTLTFSPLKGLPRAANGSAQRAQFTLSLAGCSSSEVQLLATGFVATRYGRCP